MKLTPKICLVIFLVFSTPSAWSFYSTDDRSSYYENNGDFRKPQPTSGKSFHSRQEAVHYYRSQQLQKLHADQYENHIRQVSRGGFEENDRSAVQSQANAFYPKQVLTSGSGQSNFIPRNSRYRNNGGDLNDVEPLSRADIDFINGLADGLSNEAVSAALRNLLNKQDSDSLWTKPEYEFLSGLSSNINNDQAALRLHQIAEKRRKPAYDL